MQISFLNFNAIYLLILLIPIGLISVYKFKKKINYLLILPLRLSAIGLTIFALMGPAEVLKPVNKEIKLWLGFDSSKSLDEKSLDQKFNLLWPKLQEELNKNKIAYESFLLNKDLDSYIDPHYAIRSAKAEKLNHSPIYQSIIDQISLINSDFDNRFLIFTDGNDTQNTNEDLLSLSLQKIYFVPLDYQNKDLVYIKALQNEKSILRDQKVAIEALVESKTSGNANLQFLIDHEVVEEKTVKLNNGLNLFDFETSFAKPNHYSLAVKILPEFADPFIQNNYLESQLRVFDQNAILVIGNDRQAINNLNQLLKNQDLTIDIVDPKDLKNKSIDNYSAILIIDLKEAELEQEYQEKIRTYVSNGGGLGVFGGPNSFGLGGWFHSTLEGVMPVFSPPKSYNQKSAIVLIIDSSGSMLAEDPAIWSDRLKLMRFLAKATPNEIPINVAKEAAKKVVTDLVGIDIGVVNFSDLVYRAVPMINVSDSNLPYINAGINSIQAGGGTKFVPAITGALSLVENRGYEEIYMILFSDGAPSDKAFLPDILNVLVNKNIALSTIAFGKMAAVSLLQYMADQTGGQFFNSESLDNIQGVFKEAVDRVFGPPFRKDEIKIFARDLFTGVRLPNIEGLVLTAKKERAEIILETDSQEPLLAIWNYGLGQSFVFTSDLTGNWSRNWLESPYFSQILEMILSRSMKKVHDPLVFKMSLTGNRLDMRLRALNEDGDYLDNLKAEINIIKDDNQESLIKNLMHIGDGEYKASISLNVSGHYSYSLRVSGSNIDWHRSGSFDIPIDLESTFKEANSELFEAFNKANKLINNLNDLDNLLKVDAETSLDIVKKSFVIYPIALVIFLLCTEVILRRSGLLEDGNLIKEDSEVKLRRLASSYLSQARQALHQKDLKEAERFYLAAHRLARQVDDQSLVSAIWQEYRARL